ECDGNGAETEPVRTIALWAAATDVSEAGAVCDADAGAATNGIRAAVPTAVAADASGGSARRPRAADVPPLHRAVTADSQPWGDPRDDPEVAGDDANGPNGDAEHRPLAAAAPDGAVPDAPVCTQSARFLHVGRGDG